MSIISLVSGHLFQFTLSQSLACLVVLFGWVFFPQTTCNYTGKNNNFYKLCSIRIDYPVCITLD